MADPKIPSEAELVDLEVIPVRLLDQKDVNILIDAVRALREGLGDLLCDHGCPEGQRCGTCAKARELLGGSDENRS